MKISDITQRSQVQHIAEGREKLDEVGPIGMAIGGAASYALLAAEYGTDVSKWPMAALGEFALDVGLGAVTGGTLTLAKAAAKAAMKTAAKKGLSSVAKGAGRITGKGKGPGTVNKDTGKLRGADGKDTTVSPGDKGFDKARDKIKQSRQRPDDGIPTMRQQFGKEVTGKGLGKQLSRGVAFSPLTHMVRDKITGEPFTGPKDNPYKNGGDDSGGMSQDERNKKSLKGHQWKPGAGIVGSRNVTK
jgi:hypothetical protein